VSPNPFDEGPPSASGAGSPSASGAVSPSASGAVSPSASGAVSPADAGPSSVWIDLAPGAVLPNPGYSASSVETRPPAWIDYVAPKFAPSRFYAEKGVTITNHPVASTFDEDDFINAGRSILEYRGNIGGVLYIRVRGNQNNAVWGSEVYTDDSSLDAAAVHAGVLEHGQVGTVKVTILPGRNSYVGSERHGVRSMDYGSYPGSYQVEPNDRPE
jgi:hypothetical protein